MLNKPVLLSGKAASIANMCITPHEFEVRLGDYEQYCPVSLALRGELIDCSKSVSLKYAVEYRGHYYKTSGESIWFTCLEHIHKAKKIACG